MKQIKSLDSLALTDNKFMNQSTTKELKELGLVEYFQYPKGVEFLEEILISGTDKDSIVLDFFSGSSSTAHAVMDLNAEDGGNRKFIMIQTLETCSNKSEAYRDGYKNICEIGKERIRRAGDKIKLDLKDQEDIDKHDTGFRVFKVDSSNMNDVYFNPGDNTQNLLIY